MTRKAHGEHKLSAFASRSSGYAAPQQTVFEGQERALSA
jgi:hypothetical protein